MRDWIQFLLSEALIALRRNGLMTFAAMSTSAVALFLLGGLGYVYLRVSDYATDVSGKFEMRVWLQDDVTKAQITKVAADIRTVPGVKEARWVPRDIEWAKMKADMPQVAWLENPIPHSFKVILKRLSDADQVSARIQAMPLVEKDGVTYMRTEQMFMNQMLDLLRWLGGGLGGLLLVTAGILIYNAIRLTILARRREIRIMELVGASHFTIRTPFVIEGLVQGAVGGACAAVLILAAQSGVARYVHSVNASASMPAFPLLAMMGALALIGGFFGAFCSTIAMHEPLKFRMGGPL